MSLSVVEPSFISDWVRKVSRTDRSPF